jgi:hypothetical protein
MIPHLSRAFAQISTILDTLQPLQHDILHHITSHHITLALSNQPAHRILGTKTHRDTHTHTHTHLHLPAQQHAHTHLPSASALDYAAQTRTTHDIGRANTA